MKISSRARTESIGGGIGSGLAVAVLCLVAAAPAWAGTTHGRLPAQISSRSNEGYLGIGFHDVPTDEAHTLHLKAPHGAEIDVVDHDGPAGKAGLRPRDIITSLNGQIIDSAATLKRLIHDAGANVMVALDVLRGGQHVTVQAKLASRTEVARAAQERLMAPVPPPPADAVPDGMVIQSFTVETYGAAPAVPDAGAKPGKSSFLSSMLHSGPYTGMEAEELGPQMRSYFGVGDGVGLLVNKVLPGSPAAKSGLHAGDVVVRVDGNPMRNLGDWSRHLKATKGHAMTMVVIRDRHEQTLTMTPDLKHRSSVSFEPLRCDTVVEWA